MSVQSTHAGIPIGHLLREFADQKYQPSLLCAAVAEAPSCIPCTGERPSFGGRTGFWSVPIQVGRQLGGGGPVNVERIVTYGQELPVMQSAPLHATG
jgi:hypothetical protein